MPIPFITRSVQVSCLSNKRPGALSGIVHDFLMHKAEEKVSLILPHLKKKDVILDIGAGAGSLSCQLLRRGYKTVSLDVQDFSMYEDLHPKLYNGTDIPFGKKSFDVALLIHVLHHCSDQLKVLDEAKRVAKTVIVLEDVYNNSVEKALVATSDSCNNFEFYPHTYHSVPEWRKIFLKKKLKIKKEKFWSCMFPQTTLFSRQAMFVLSTT